MIQCQAAAFLGIDFGTSGARAIAIDGESGAGLTGPSQEHIMIASAMHTTYALQSPNTCIQH